MTPGRQPSPRLPAGTAPRWPAGAAGWRQLAAVLLPMPVAAAQWLLWRWIDPYAWVLFFPIVFLSARLGGSAAGLASTLLAAALVWYLFIPPRLSLAVDTPGALVSLVSFVLVGFLASSMYGRLARLQQRSEARFEATFEQAATGIALVAPDGRWLRVNRKLCEIVGYEPRELLALGFQEITHPDDLGADLDAVRRMLAREIANYSLEKRYLRKGGGSVWIRLTVSLVWRPDGEPDYFIAVIEDIEARKAAEAASRTSEAALREAQRLAHIGSWTWDFRNDQARWSEELYDILGRDPALPPADFLELPRYFTPESWARLAGAVDRCSREGLPYGIDAEVLRPDGGRRWVFARGEAVRDGSGRIVELHGTMQDISEQKRVEASLRESEERLRLFIRHAPAALAMFDRDMRYLAVSRRWLDDYRLGGEDLVGRSHYEVFPEIGQRWKEIHQRALAGETLRADQDRFERADGSAHWLRWEVHPWPDGNGRIGGMVIFSEDITRYKEARDEIEHLNRDLERRVEERTAELLAANRELDSFAYAVSHDLRAPLRAMSGFSRMLEESWGDDLGGEAARYLSQIRIASRRMSELIDGILALSRVSRGELRDDPIDLSAMAERILRELAAAEPLRRVDWEIEAGLDARGDARLIESVMSNLLDNAWKYTARTVAARIRVYRRGGCFCVADNGSGFDPEHAAGLFEPFRRLHRQEEFPGIGIGLATVRRIVQRHGGDIQASSAPGRGATFCFRLGADAAAASAREGGDAGARRYP